MAACINSLSLEMSVLLFQPASRTAALPVSLGRHSAVISDIAAPYHPPLSGRHFEPQLDIGRPPSWLISYPCVPCDSVTAYHSLATNVVSAQAAEFSAARGSAASPKAAPGSVVHGRHDRAAVSHLPEGATHDLQGPGRADKEPRSRASPVVPHTMWSRDRLPPLTEATEFAGHLHSMSSGPVHPLKQVQLVTTYAVNVTHNSNSFITDYLVFASLIGIVTDINIRIVLTQDDSVVTV